MEPIRTALLRIWNPARLADVVPAGEWRMRAAYWTFTAACLLGAAALPAVGRRLHPGLRRRLSAFGWVNGLLGIFFGLSREARLPVLGMDLWRFLQLIAAVFHANSFARYSYLVVPAERIARKAAERREKYLPKPKQT